MWAGKLRQESEKVASLRAELKRAQGTPALRSPAVHFGRLDAQHLPLSASEQSEDCMDTAFDLDSGPPETTEAAKPKQKTATGASTGLHGLKASLSSRDADAGGQTRVTKRPQSRQTAMKASKSKKKSRTSGGATAEKGRAVHPSSRPLTAPGATKMVRFTSPTDKNGQAGRSRRKSGQVPGTKTARGFSLLPEPSAKKRGGADNAKGATKTVRSPKSIGVDTEAGHEVDHDMFGEGSLDPYSIENFF